MRETKRGKMYGSKKQQACMECTEKCLKTHGKKPSSSVPTPATSLSFFKIMLGDFKEAVFIPPKFAQTIQDLVNKDTYLEDSNGHRWRVTISLVRGSLAFHQGWRDFVLDHNIELGEFVIFKYISRSLLSTQIFGMSACERLHFHGRSNNDKRKRKRSKGLEENNRSSEASKEKCLTMDDPTKEDRAIESVLCDLFDNKMTVKNCVAIGVAEDIHPAEKFVLLQTVSTRNNYEAPCDTTNEDAMWVEKAGKISFIDLCNDEDKDYSFPSLDYSGGCQTTGQVEYAINKKGNQVAGNSSIRRFPITKEHTSTVDPPVAYTIVDTSSAFEQEAIIIPPINSAVPETTEAQCSFQEADKLLFDVEILSSQHDKLANYPLTKEHRHAMNHPEAPYNMVLKSSAFEQEMMIIPPIDLVNPETFENQLEVDEERFSCLHNNLSRSKTGPTIECTKSETKNQIEARGPMISYPPIEKGLCTIDCSQVQNLSDNDWLRKQEVHNMHTFDMSDPEMINNKPDTEELVDIIVSSPRHMNKKCTADERVNLIASNGVVQEFVIPEEWISYNVDEDSMNKLEASRDEPVGLCHNERGRGDSVYSTIEVAMTKKNSSPSENSLEAPSSIPVLNCTEDIKGNLMSSCEPISKDAQTEEQLGNVPAPGYGMEDASYLKTDHLCMTDDKKVLSCSKGKASRVVKTKSKDCLPSPNCANFSFSATVNSRFWLKLPEKLPILVGKKRLERRVVALRDPNMRMWPVLYHVGIKFVGFIGGWEEFAAANNLQKGDRCEFELVNELVPTFQLWSSKALHPMQAN